MTTSYQPYKLAFVTALAFLVAHARAADYFVDSTTGSDQNSGLSVIAAWKSLAPVNATIFKPGDRVEFKSGTTYTGNLDLKGSGNADHRIELCSYGTGAKPRIDGEGKFADTILLHNAGGWFIHDIEITNHGPTTAPGRTGVRLECDNGQVMSAVHLSGLYVHDVNGDLRKDYEGCGIFFDTRARGSRFDDLLIENCHIEKTDRNGLCQRSLSRDRSTRVVIRNNLLENIGGDGIKLWGTNGGLIEHNTIHGGRERCDDYAAGIWPFACDDTVIQYNEVSGMKGIKDGEGFDSDYVCRRSIFQYNYSHDNDGGFILVCAPASSYCQDTIIRYNISQHDGRADSQVFHFAGNSSQTQVYNNLIYIGPDQNVPMLAFDAWDGASAHHSSFRNNIFYVDGKVTYDWGKSVDNTFDHNVFFGNHVSPPNDLHAITQRPALVKPGGGADGFASLDCYRWQRGAVIPMGIPIPDYGGHDFFGAAISADQAPAVGIQQAPR